MSLHPLTTAHKAVTSQTHIIQLNTLRRQVAVSGDKLPKVEHVELRQLVDGDKQLVASNRNTPRYTVDKFQQLVAGDKLLELVDSVSRRVSVAGDKLLVSVDKLPKFNMFNFRQLVARNSNLSP